MNVLPDNARFDALQMHLLNEIVASIRDGMRDAGVDDAQVLYEATGNIAFSIAAIVDGSRVMNLDDQEVLPILTFARERDGKELIGAEAGGSWMHEYVFGVVDELFEGGADRDDELDESVDLGGDDDDDR